MGQVKYTKGTTLLKLTGKQEKEDAEVLPIEKLKGIYPHKNLIDPIKLINFMNFASGQLTAKKLSLRERKAIFNDYITPFTISILALNTGMRNSEVGRIKREDFIGVKEKETFLLRVWNKKTEYFNKTNESKYRKIPLHAYTIEAVKIFIQYKEELYGTVKDTDFIFGKSIIDKDTGKIDGFLHSKIFDKAVYVLLKLIIHKDDFSSFFSNEKELIKTMGDIKSLQEELKEIKDAGKGITFYSFRKTFRTMLGLKNDLAEYYMGHKLGNDAKTTYIQVNSLDNKLFVEEYAQPVFEMLDKFVFFSDDDLKEMAEKNINKLKEHVDFMAAKIRNGISPQEAYNYYAIKDAKEMLKNEYKPPVIGYFERI